MRFDVSSFMGLTAQKTPYLPLFAAADVGAAVLVLEPIFRWDWNRLRFRQFDWGPNGLNR